MRQAHKAIAASLGEALPPMLSVLESALQSNPSGAGLLALENLAEVAEAQPRLFKPVLAQVVVEGTLTSTLTLTLALTLALALALTLTLTRRGIRRVAGAGGGAAGGQGGRGLRGVDRGAQARV